MIQGLKLGMPIDPNVVFVMQGVIAGTHEHLEGLIHECPNKIGGLVVHTPFISLDCRLLILLREKEYDTCFTIHIKTFVGRPR